MVTDLIAEIVNDVIFRLLLTTGIVLLALEANIKQYRFNRVSNERVQSSSQSSQVPLNKVTDVELTPTLSASLFSESSVDQALNEHDEDYVDAIQFDINSPREPDRVAHTGDKIPEKPDQESLVAEIERLTMENNAYKNQVMQLHFDIERFQQENSDMVQLLNVIESQLQTQQVMRPSHQNNVETSLEQTHEDQTDFQLTSPAPTTRFDCSYPAPMFHVVCVGDSGVGKTSFIRKLCTSQDFSSTFSTTIGVDFLMKTLVINQRPVTLQMWDTAGQERYRCLTHQYFRKADGVIIMYDVTSESSFRNLHSWLDSAQASVSDGTVLVLVGNKKDLVKNSSARVISELDGAVLAKEYDVSIFSEVSAKSGNGVLKIVEDMTSHLLSRQPLVDKQIVRLTSHKQPNGRGVYRTYSCCTTKPVSYLYTKQ